MKHFAIRYPNPPRKNGETFRYRDRPEGDVVECAIRFNEGGTNYATYKSETKGLYLHITPMNVKRENGFEVAGMMLLGSTKQSGAKILIMPLTRRNMKKMEAAAELLDAIVPELCALFREDPAKAFARVREVCPL